MNHLGLFEGIGGFSLAARWAGWHTVAWCEINPFGQQVLKYHFPNAKGHDDITKTDFTVYRGTVDIITGGFPCQPYSTAGKRLGKDDERHLWPEMLRAIREVQPRWVVGENVSGLVNWSGGLVFDEVQTDLEAEGYEVRAFVLPAAGVGAPHRRDRVWFIAYANVCAARSSGQGGATEIDRRVNDDEQSSGPQQAEQYFGCGEFLRAAANACCDGYQHRELGENRCSQAKSKGQKEKWQRVWCNVGGTCEQKTTANATSPGRKDRQQNGKRANTEGNKAWRNFPTQSPICSRNDGLPGQLAGITFSKWRNESIKSYGNAIVPQVALQIFESVNEYENSQS